MANTIKVTYKVNEDGSLERISKKAEKAAKSTDGLARSKQNYNKLEKGTAQLTSNTTKAFSKQVQTIGGGGFVAAYATLAANIFAVTAAFGALQRAAAVQQLEKGLIFTGRAAGQNLPMVVDRLRDITDGALAAADAMNAVALGISAGFSESQLEGLTKVARGASLALGRDMTDAMARLTRGAAKLEPEILDELGIMVRLDDTTRKYAASVGKTAAELTQFERRMAFTNAIIEQGQKKFGALAEIVDPNPYDKLAASFDGLTKDIINLLNKALKPVASFLADNVIAVFGIFAGLSVKVVNALIPALTGAGTAMAALASESAAAAKANIGSVKSFEGAPKEYTKLTSSIKKGTASEKEMTKAKNSLTRSISMHNKQMESFTKRHGEGSKAVADKTAKVNAAKAALNRITAAEAQATLATQLNTRATLLNAAAKGDLRGMLAALRLMWAGEIAATAAATAGKGLLTTSLAYLRKGFSLASVSAKAFGIALLSAIPVIGQIIIIATIAYEALSSFFSTDPTALDKELENVQKRIEEFPKVIDQMSNAYLVATSRVEKFVAAFKPLAGLGGQVDSQLQSLISVQVAENLGKQIKKTKELMDAEEKLRKAIKKKEEASKKPSMSEFSGVAESVSVRMAQQNIDRLKKEVDDLREAGIDTDRTIEGAKETMLGYSASLRTAKTFLEEGTSEYKAYSTAIKNADEVIKLLNEGSIEEAIKKHRESATALKAELTALNDVADAVAKVDAFFLSAAEKSGFFAERNKLLQTSLNNLKPGLNISPEIVTLYEALGQFKGINFPKLEEGEILSESQAKKIRQEIEALSTAYKELDQRAKDLRFAQVGYDIDAIEAARKFGEGSDKARIVALENQQIMQNENLKLEQDKLGLLESGTDEFDNQLLVVQQLLLAQEKLNQSKVSTAMNAKGSTADRFKTAIESGGLEEAGSQEKIAILENAITPMREALSELGPEGELMATVTQGAFAMAEAFTTAFEDIEAGGSVLENGLAMAGAAVNALASIQAAQSKAAIAAIDKQIAAEKRRDGTSTQSLAKIAAMEKKKEAMKRKAFEQDKKAKMASVIINTASAIMGVWNVKDPYVGPALATAYTALIAGLGAAQLSAIASTSYQGGGGGVSKGPSKISVGNRQNSVDLAKARSPSGELAYARGAQGTGQGMTNYTPTPAFTGTKYRAAGGNTAFMVGEQGPEMFVPDRPGTIVPADETQGFTGQPVNVNFSISAVDSSGVEDLLMSQRGNLISMIREAANAHGELFLETVNDKAIPSREARKY